MSKDELNTYTAKKNEQLNILQNELLNIKEAIQQLNLKASIVNIEITSIHDPATSTQIKVGKEICDECATRFNYRIESKKKHEKKLTYELVVQEMEE